VLAASGFFPAGLLPGLWVPEDSLVEFGSSSECCRFLAARAPSRFMIAEATTNLPGTRDPPLLGFLLPRTPQRRVPRRHDRAETRPWSARSASSSPVPSSGFLPLSTVLDAPRNVRTPRGARRPPCRPDASRPCSMPLASLESPFRAFALPGSRTRSRGPLLPCGFAFGHGRRDVRERFTTAFPAAPTPCLGLPVKARRTTGP